MKKVLAAVLVLAMFAMPVRASFVSVVSEKVSQTVEFVKKHPRETIAIIGTVFFGIFMVFVEEAPAIEPGVGVPFAQLFPDALIKPGDII